MRVISFSEARGSLKGVIDRVVADADYTVIARRDAPDAVVMSLDTFNGLMDTVHLLKSPANAAHLVRSIEQYRKGEVRQMPTDVVHKLTWTSVAWDDYTYWQSQDKKTLKRINALLEDVLRQPFEGIGKPEPLKENLSGFWSRRIDDTHRLVYCVDADNLVVIACRYHY
jgi:toxin YoeB